jgi:hypothetical protein
MVYQFNVFSSIGLIIDIIGVIFLFKFGLPSDISIGGFELREELETEERERLSRNKKIKKMANIGLVCLILGFILQLVGSNFKID